jgi:hypothetical protein
MAGRQTNVAFAMKVPENLLASTPLVLGRSRGANGPMRDASVFSGLSGPRKARAAAVHLTKQKGATPML